MYYPSSTVFNLNSPYCASPIIDMFSGKWFENIVNLCLNLLNSLSVDKYLPIEIIFDGRWGYPCCWSLSEIPWTPYCISDSSVTPTYCTIDSSKKTEQSISSYDGDCCSSSKSRNSSKSTKKGRCVEHNPDSIWRFPKTSPPPIPLPGWNPLP